MWEWIRYNWTEKAFRLLWKQAKRVKRGQKLLAFDMDLISKVGYSLATPVLVTNCDEFEQVEITEAKEVQAGDSLLCVM